MRRQSTTPVLDPQMGQAPYISKWNFRSWYISSTTTVLDLWRTNPLIYKKYSPTRRQLIDYYGTRPEKRQHLKKSYSSTRWKLRKRHDLYIHTRWSTKKSPYKKNLPIHWPKSHIYMAKRRYNTSYWSINFTIWSATDSASSTNLTNCSWSQVKHMP